MNKKVLLICPDFYDYPQLIKKALKDNGCSVDLHLDEIGLGYRIAKNFRVLPLCRYLKRRAIQKLQRKVVTGNYDSLFIIRGENIGCEFLQQVKVDTPDTKIIMYQWDSVRNHDYSQLLPYVDYVSTFDPKDAETLGIDYLPLFYTDQKADLGEKVYDFCFIGSYHGDRLDLLQQLDSIFKKHGFSFYCYLYVPFLVWFRDRFIRRKSLPLCWFKFSKISHAKVLDLFKGAKVVVDIHSGTQTGFTMRSMEALSCGANLLTTNELMSDLSERIYVLSRRGEESVVVASLVKCNSLGLDIGLNLCEWVRKHNAL